jgi:glycosyltransferase involved in cell wall biosynthesis
VKAFNMLCDPELHLVLAGGKGWLYDELFVTVEALGLKSRVLFQGYVDDSDLPLLYSAAETFVLPSLYEGFGFPIIEAQACGTPVVTSETTALPEAAGGAACLVNPLSVEAMAESLHQVTNDQVLRSRLRAKGLRNAAGFRWTTTAQRTAAAYRRALSGSDLP